MTDFQSNGYTVKLSQQELDALTAVLSAGDRGSFYLTYAAMTDSNEAVLQAKISTFSGLVGGAAFAANRFLQDEYGVDGTVSDGKYPGIYFLSQQVALSGLDAIKASAGSSTGTGV